MRSLSRSRRSLHAAERVDGQTVDLSAPGEKAELLGLTAIGALRTFPPPVHFERRTPQFKPQPQRPRLAGGGRSHSCRNLDCERLAGHVGLLPPHAPTAYNGRVVPA